MHTCEYAGVERLNEFHEPKKTLLSCAKVVYPNEGGQYEDDTSLARADHEYLAAVAPKPVTHITVRSQEF